MTDKHPFAEFGKWLKAKRLSKRVTALTLAKALSRPYIEAGLPILNQRMIYMLENGAVLPRPAYIRGIAKALGLDENELRETIHKLRDEYDEKKFQEELLKAKNKKDRKHVPR